MRPELSVKNATTKEDIQRLLLEVCRLYYSGNVKELREEDFGETTGLLEDSPFQWLHYFQNHFTNEEIFDLNCPNTTAARIQNEDSFEVAFSKARKYFSDYNIITLSKISKDYYKEEHGGHDGRFNPHTTREDIDAYVNDVNDQRHKPKDDHDYAPLKNHKPQRKINPTHFQRIKASLISIFAKLVNGITSMVKKMKDGRVKKFLLNLLRKAQAGLSKSKSLQIAKPQMAKQLSDSAKEIQEKLNQMQKAQEGFTCESFIGITYGEIAEEGIFSNFFKRKSTRYNDDTPRENPRNAEDYFENDLARIDANFWDELSSYDGPLEPVKSKRNPSREQIQRCQPMIKAMKEFEKEATKFVQAANKTCTSREQCFSIINPGKYALHGNSKVGVVHKYIAKYDVPRDVDDCEASINRAFDELVNNLFELEGKMRQRYPSIRIELEEDKNNTDCSPLMDEGRYAWMIEFRMVF